MIRSSLFLSAAITALFLAGTAVADGNPAEAKPATEPKPATEAKPAAEHKPAGPPKTSAQPKSTAAKPAAPAVAPAIQEASVQMMVPSATNLFWSGMGAAPVYAAPAPVSSYAVSGAGGQVVNVSFQMGTGLPVATPIAVPTIVPTVVPAAGGAAQVAFVQTHSVQAPAISVSARVIPTGSVWQPNGLSGYPGLSSAFTVGATGMTHKLDVASPILATAPVANPYTIRQ